MAPNPIPHPRPIPRPRDLSHSSRAPLLLFVPAYCDDASASPWSACSPTRGAYCLLPLIFPLFRRSPSRRFHRFPSRRFPSRSPILLQSSACEYGVPPPTSSVGAVSSADPRWAVPRGRATRPAFRRFRPRRRFAATDAAESESPPPPCST